MDRLEMIISVLDHALNTRHKRHLVGGILLSVSLLFGGLAATILTLKEEEENNDKDNDNARSGRSTGIDSDLYSDEEVLRDPYPGGNRFSEGDFLE